VPVKANSGVRACVPAAGKVLEGDDKPTLLREDQHYLHYITIILYKQPKKRFFQRDLHIIRLCTVHSVKHCRKVNSLYKIVTEKPTGFTPLFVMMLEDIFVCISSETGLIWT